MSEATLLVRIKPYNKKTNNLIRSYTINSIKYLEEYGWYEVSSGVAEVLDEVYEDDVKVFDVVSRARALAIDAKAAEVSQRATAAAPRKLGTATAPRPKGVQGAVRENADPHTLSTRDLPSNKPAPEALEPEDGEDDLDGEGDVGGEEGDEDGDIEVTGDPAADAGEPAPAAKPGKVAPPRGRRGSKPAA
jgi:hypothetical protein